MGASIAAQESTAGQAPTAHEDARAVEVEKLVKALGSSECSVRWEGVKEAISSWEQAFYLYPEIERRATVASGKSSSHKKLTLVRKFIQEQIGAMQYRERLDTKLTEAKSAGRMRKLQLQKDLEAVIRDSSKTLMKRIFSLDVSLDLSEGSTLQDYISDSDRHVGLVASNLAVMRGSYTELDEFMLDMIGQTLLDGIKSESFSTRYLSLRSLEKLRLKDDLPGCIDPTDIPSGVTEEKERRK